MCPRKKISSPFSLGWSQRTASRRRKRRKQPAGWRPVKISYLVFSFVVCFFLAHVYKYCFILFFLESRLIGRVKKSRYLKSICPPCNEENRNIKRIISLSSQEETGNEKGFRSEVPISVQGHYFR